MKYLILFENFENRFYDESHDFYLESIRGDFDSILKKVKEYSKKGLMTAAILGSLLSSPNYTNAQKQEIKQASSIEKVQDNTISGKDLASAMLSYLNTFGDKISSMSRFNKDGISGKETVKQVMIRCQMIRDGIKPGNFTNTEEPALMNIIKKIILDKVNESPGQVIDLIMSGKKVSVNQ